DAYVLDQPRGDLVERRAHGRELDLDHLVQRQRPAEVVLRTLVDAGVAELEQHHVEAVHLGDGAVPVEDEPQRCDVTPAGSSSAVVAPGSSYREKAYVPSSRSRAKVVRRSGWKVSHITASSCVSASPIDFSASPGCGPCGMPDGCSVIDPTSTAFREEKLP